MKRLTKFFEKLIFSKPKQEELIEQPVFVPWQIRANAYDENIKLKRAEVKSIDQHYLEEVE